MAASDLNLDLDYFDHPKTKRLVRKLGRNADVLPIRLWCYTGKFFADTGRLTNHPTDEIESIVAWWKEPGECEKALIEAGFGRREGADFIVHDFLDRNGHIKAYKERGKAGAKARWGVKHNANEDTSNAKALLKHCQNDNKQCANHTNQPYQPTELNQPSPSLPTHDDGGGGVREETETMKALREAGVVGSAVFALAAKPGITPFVVRLVAHRVKGSTWKNKGVGVCRELEEWKAGPMSAKEVMELVKAGVISSVEGKPVAEAKWNKEGVYFYDAAGNQVAALANESLVARRFAS